jgi:prevent-host-death family protein
MEVIQIPLRELHARTGHFVRMAAGNLRVIITDNGKPIAQIQPIGVDADSAPPRTKWKNRRLLPEYAAIMNAPVGGTNSSQIIAEDRERNDGHDVL